MYSDYQNQTPIVINDRSSEGLADANIRIGNMLSLGFEKIILLYNETIYETADVISSFVYRYGLQKGNYSYATAVGLFNSLFNFILLIGVNALSRKVSDVSLR